MKAKGAQQVLADSPLTDRKTPERPGGGLMPCGGRLVLEHGESRGEFELRGQDMEEVMQRRIAGAGGREVAESRYGGGRLSRHLSTVVSLAPDEKGSLLSEAGRIPPRRRG